MSRNLLTINTGSSSVKAALYRADAKHNEQLWKDQVEGIGAARDFTAAMRSVMQRLPERELHAIGHRVVHGGQRYAQPSKVTRELLDYLKELVSIDPTHLPQAVQAIEACREAFPEVPQVACFDTAFHRTMPRVAQLYPLPRELFAEGIQRYGFHGLSYEYVFEELRQLEPELARGRVVIAHLGNGSSMVAIRDGQSVDTTMGFSPTGGLMMGTRSGDVDPGVLLHLQQARGLGAAEVSELVNRRSGLLGVSGRTFEVRELLARRDDVAAQEAIELFCYQARKFLGSLTAVLGGLDVLVFTGGIGEHAAELRWRMCERLGYLGLVLDPDANASNRAVISASGAGVKVRIILTDEDAVIARDTYRLVFSQE